MTEPIAPYDGATALLVVDVQNDFAEPDGSLSVDGALAVIPVLRDEIHAALAAGAVVVYSQDWHPDRTPHFAAFGGAWPAHCVMGTWGAELHAGLPVVGHVVRKGSNGEDGYSAFTMRDPLTGATIETELHAILRDRGVRRVVVGGLATDYCVMETGIDALRLGYATVVLSDAVRAVDVQSGDGDRSIERLRGAGATNVGRLAGGTGPGGTGPDGAAGPGANAGADAGAAAGAPAGAAAGAPAG
jgi:nicotinamidase/pyrazinamidase